MTLAFASACGGGGGDANSATPTEEYVATPTTAPSAPTATPIPEDDAGDALPDDIAVNMNNLLERLNFSFEDGADDYIPDWRLHTDSGAMAHETKQKRGGEASVYITGNTDGTAGPSADITEILLENGMGYYYMEAWVLPEDNGNFDTYVCVELNSGTGFETVTTNPLIAYKAPFFKANTAFKCVSGVVMLSWSGGLDEARIYIKSAAESYWVDDVYLYRFDALTEILLPNAGFEDPELDPWFPNEWDVHTCTVDRDISESNTGAASAMTTDKTNDACCPVLDIVPILNEYGKGRYYFEYYAKCVDEENTTSICVGTNSATGWAFPVGGSTYIDDQSFKKIMATIDVPWDGTLIDGMVYVGGSGSEKFWVDDVRMFKLPDEVK